MKKSLLTLACIFTIAVASIAQDGPTIKIEVPDGPVPWNNLNVNNNPETFQFAIVTDRTGGHRPGVFLDGVQKLNLLQPEFVMSVGDLIEGYTEDTARLNWEWNQFSGFIDSLQMPFFYLPGNHDMTNKVMKKKWEERFGRSYYHFLYKDVLFLCLNSEDNYRGAGRGTIDDQQYNYIEKALEEHQDAKWTLLFMHQPLWNQHDTKRWKDVEKLLEPRKHTVFVGHNHRYRKYERNNGKYFVLATTGGGSALRGPNFGEFDHVVWVTMTDEGPIIANLLLEGIWHEDVMNNEFANFIYPVANNFPVQIEPVFIDGKTFIKERSKVKISNSSDYKLNADYHFQSSANLIVEPGIYSGTVDPNDVIAMDLNLQGINISDLQKIDPLQMNVKLKYDIAERPNVVLERSYKIRPAIKYEAEPISKSVKIDGKLKEWGKMAYTIDRHSHVSADPFSHTGDKDASSGFSVHADKNYLYIASEVIDDEIVVKNGKNPLYQDAVFLFIDGRPLKESSMNTDRNMSSEWILIAISPDIQGTVYKKQSLPKGVKTGISRTKKGYVVEAAIPLAYLEEKQLGPWSSCRINVMINDYDQGGKHNSRISWKPLWNGKNNYIASGTFFKK